MPTPAHTKERRIFSACYRSRQVIFKTDEHIKCIACQPRSRRCPIMPPAPNLACTPPARGGATGPEHRQQRETGTGSPWGTIARDGAWAGYWAAMIAPFIREGIGKRMPFCLQEGRKPPHGTGADTRSAGLAGMDKQKKSRWRMTSRLLFSLYLAPDGVAWTLSRLNDERRRHSDS